MKKALFIVVILLFGVGLALPVSNLIIGQPKNTVLSRTQWQNAATRRLAEILEGPCADCHLEGLAAPWYAALPVAATLIQRDKTKGLRWWDMEEALGPAEGPPSEPGLAKLEREIMRGTMPPPQYLLMHWKARLGSEEKRGVAASIRELRVAYFAEKGLPSSVAEQVVRPLPKAVPADPVKAALGERLYHDKRLSEDDTISCASCHELTKGGTDQAPVSTGIRHQKGPINAPTTFNAVFQFAQFWDGRARDLQEQAAGPVENPLEMGTTFERVIEKLNADEDFRAAFQAAYPEGFTKETITHAIAEFEKTLITHGDAFDRFLLGDQTALTEVQKRGWEAFQREGCVTCHVGSLLGGQSFELMGRAKDYFAVRGNVTDADLGRYAVTKQEKDRHRFKVPTLRNVERTFPYFHDGTVTDLLEAVQKMAEFQFGKRLKDADASAIVEFLKALTGTWRGKTI